MSKSTQIRKKDKANPSRGGLAPVKNDFQAVIYLLGHQHMMDSATINTLLQGFWSNDKDICIPTYRGGRKTPVIFSRRFYSQLMDIKGDIGARQIIDANPEQVLRIEIDDHLCFFDIDTEQDFEKMKKKLTQVE